MDARLAMTLTFALVVAFAVSAALTPLVRKLGRERGYIDVPNERSSHAVPTPKTGGYAVVIAIVAAVAVSGAFLEPRVAAMIAGAMAVTLLAFADDRWNVSRLLRLFLQMAIAAALVVFANPVGFVNAAPLPSLHVAAAVAVPLAIVWIIGVVNAYNFMDGLNGMAAFEAIVCGLAFGILLLRSHDTAGAAVAFAAAGAAAGFVPFNVPSGSIFMGDSGSSTLGFLFGFLVLRIASHGTPLAAAVLPLAPFLFDAGITLLRRMIKGERFFSQPHRSHFYQRLNQLGWRHASVSGSWAAMAVVSSFAALAYDGLTPLAQAVVLAGITAMHVAAFVAITLRESRRTAVA